jgi:hypothetical protein
MSAGGVTRPQARGGGGLGRGMRRGRLSGSTRRKGGDMERERMFDIHACTGVSWRKTWDTGTAPFSATLTARDSTRHYSYVQLKRGSLCPVLPLHLSADLASLNAKPTSYRAAG